MSTIPYWKIYAERENETLREALALMDEMTYADCECDKAHPGGYCPLCSKHERVVSILKTLKSALPARDPLKLPGA